MSGDKIRAAVVSDTQNHLADQVAQAKDLDGLIEDFVSIGHSEEEAKVAAKNVLKYDQIEL